MIGALGGLIYFFTARLLLKLRIDDPLEAAPVHFFCGIWGLLSVGIFATEHGVKAAYNRELVVLL